MMTPPLLAEYVEDECDQEDRPGADGGSPDSVAEVMHIRADHPEGDGGRYQECREGKGKTQRAWHPGGRPGE
jgi:hypothetical protein